MDRNLLQTPTTQERFASDPVFATPLGSAHRLLKAYGPGGNSPSSLTSDAWKHYPYRSWEEEQANHTGRVTRTTTCRPGILVVDDDVVVRDVLNTGLWQHGFIVWLAGSGSQALELYESLRAEIDLVVLDVRMPGLDGPRTLAALQRLNPRIRCCFMSGNFGSYTREDLLERGALRVVQKPFHLHEFAQMLWQLLSPRLTEEARSELPQRTVERATELFLG